MNNKFDFTLRDDSPKTNPKDDLLGYAPFAKKIAKTVVSLRAPCGYVIGIHGAWGSGKSTVLNFVTGYLSTLNSQSSDTPLVHIDFRPWIVPGHHDLIAAFFKVLSEHLGPKKSRRTVWFKKNHDVVSNSSNSLVDAAATFAITMDPSAGVISCVSGNVAKKSLSKLIDSFVEEPSLQKAYGNLRKLLSDSGKRFLVTIDDIDRLEDTEVRSIMRMVKSIGQLPNVIYLLSYDRKIVWNVLDNGVASIGTSFGEKIVQQELELPQPSRNALLKMLDQETAFLVGDTEHSFRWELLLRDGVHRWMRSPRDVVRLSNALKFSFTALCDEIDPQDLMGIEGLRLFDSVAFNWVRENRDFLFNDGWFRFVEDGVKEEAVENLKQQIPEGKRSQVLGVIMVLFPQLAKWLDSDAAFAAEESYNEVEKRRGVGCAVGYDSYFGLHLSADAVPLSELRELVSPGADVDGIEKIIRRYLAATNSRGVPMVGKVLHELRIQYTGNKAIQPTQAMLYALFRVGEEVIGIDRGTNMWDLQPRSLINFLIYDMLMQWGLEKSGEYLLEAFKKGGSPAFLAEVYATRGRELGIFHEPPRDQPCITASNFEKLGEVLIDKIETGYKDGTLSDAPFYFNIVRSWIHLSTSESAKSWLKEGIFGSGEFMAKVCIGLVAYSIGTDGRHYEMHDRPDPELYELDVLVDAGIKHCKEAELTEEQRHKISAVITGAKRFLESKEIKSSPAVSE